MWGLPRPGVEPVSLALAGGFLSAVPPGNLYIEILTVKVLKNVLLTMVESITNTG